MKQLLLLCCITAAACGITRAQTTATTSIQSNKVGSTTQTIMPAVSKSEFSYKITQLNKLLNESDMANANITWDEINQMMMTEFAIVKRKISNAVNASDMADKDRYMNLTTSQSGIYNDIIEMKDAMIRQRKAIITQLNAFNANML